MDRTIKHFSIRISILARATMLALLLLGVAATPARSGEVQHEPLAFEANRGQTDPQVSFLARGGDYTVFLTPTEAVLTLGSREPERAVVRLKPVGTSPTTHLIADDPLPGVVNYSRVPDTAPISVPTYARVVYADLYPGVDLVYYGRPQQLEYDFVIAPGADPGRIQLALDGADPLELDAQGELVLHTGAGLLRQPRPVAYQEIDGTRRAVTADYVIADGRVGFRLGAYDRSHRLVIDPVLAFSTYLGGSNEEMDWLFGPAFGIAVDTAGNTYVTGSTTSVNFPTTPGAYRTLSGSQDAFVTKLSPTGAVLYSTYLGGPCDDIGNDIAVDGGGNAYVTGRAHGGVCMVQVNAGVLVAKLSPTGTVVYALVFGGGLVDTSAGKAIAVDAQGRAYVTGTTASSGFPTTPGAVRTTSCPTAIDPTYTDGFVARISAAGALVYATFLCGDGYDQPHDIAVDTAGNMYVAGWTASGNFPTVNPLQATSHVYPFGTTGFVSKLAADGSHLIYSTYLGGSINDYVNGLALDGQGNVYVAGKTESGDFPTTAGVLQPQRGNLICIDQFCTDAFVSKINAAGSAIVYSTYLYGEGDDGAEKIAVDAAGDAYVVGTTSSLFFPIRDAFQAISGVRGPSDAFVAKLNPDATRLLYSSYLGGSGPFESPQTGEDEGSAIAIDGAGNAYVAGFTRSYDFPTTPGAFQPNIGGGTCDYFGAPCGDAFVAKIGAGGPGAASPTRVDVTPNAIRPGGTVNATWALPNPTPSDYLILYALGSGSETYAAYWTTGGAAAGTLALALPANLAHGNYEIRLLSPDPNYGGALESVARSQPIHVGATNHCGFGFELGAVMPLLSALRRRTRA